MQQFEWSQAHSTTDLQLQNSGLQEPTRHTTSRQNKWCMEMEVHVWVHCHPSPPSTPSFAFPGSPPLSFSTLLSLSILSSSQPYIYISYVPISFFHPAHLASLISLPSAPPRSFSFYLLTHPSLLAFFACIFSLLFLCPPKFPPCSFPSRLEHGSGVVSVNFFKNVCVVKY